MEGDGDNSASPSPVSPRKKMQIDKLGGLAMLNPQMLSCKYTVNLQSIAQARPPPLVHNKPRLRSGTRAPSKQLTCLARSHASARLYLVYLPHQTPSLIIDSAMFEFGCHMSWQDIQLAKFNHKLIGEKTGPGISKGNTPQSTWSLLILSTTHALTIVIM